MTDEVLDGIECKKITCTNPENKNSATYWIAPALGSSIIRIDCDDNEGCVDSTVLQVAKDTRSGIWLPTSSKFTRIAQGKLEISEELRIEVLSLNQSLDLSYFTPQKMEVPVGTLTIMMPESTEQNYFWDGEKIVGENGSVFENTGERNHFSNIRLFLIAVGLAMVSVACFWKFMACREKQKETPSLPNVTDK